MSKIHKALQRAEQEAGVRPLTPLAPPLVVEPLRPQAQSAPSARPVRLDDASFPLAAFTPAAKAYLEPARPVLEEYHGLQNRLELQPASLRARSILITSSMPGEGCSVVALGMAAAFVRRGGRRSVLLVDGDTRRPNLERFFTLDGRPGSEVGPRSARRDAGGGGS